MENDNDMNFSELSKEEIITIESYKNLAENGYRMLTGKNLDPTFWKDEFGMFQTYLKTGLVLDVGCGMGRDAKLFRDSQSFRYIGIDVSEPMLKNARLYCPEADFRLMSFYKLNFKNDFFDGCWVPASLLHVHKRDVHRPLNEIFRVLKSGGVCFIAMKEGEGESVVKLSEEDKRFFSFYSLEEFLEYLETAGFHNIQCDRIERQTSIDTAPVQYLTYFMKKN